MANIQTVKAQKAEKTLRLMTILLLVVALAVLALTVYDWASQDSMLNLFNPAPAAEDALAEEVAADATQTATDATKTDETAEELFHSSLTVARVMLITAAALLVIGAITHLVKNNYRVFQGTCIAAIIFSLFPLIFFAVNVGTYLFALIFALLALAIIVLSIFAMKSRWQVYIKEMTGEVKKLTWLSMKELVKATAVVLVFVLAFAILIYALDWIFYTPVKAALDHTPATAEPAADEELPEDTETDTDVEPEETGDTDADSAENNG